MRYFRNTLITLIIIVLGCCNANAYDFEVDGIYYRITAKTKKEVSVTHNGSHSYFGVVNIPSTVEYNNETYTVTSIGSRAFYYSAITAVTIPNSVVTIEYESFRNCSNLKNVTIPNSVTNIRDEAFYDCDSIKSITIGAGVTYIGNNAFDYIPKVIWLCNTPPTGASNIWAGKNYVSNNEFGLSYQTIYPFLSSRFEVDNVIYVPVSPSDRTCDVIDCNYTPISTDITIGEVVNNKGIELTVLDVNDYAFYGNDAITSLKISNKGDICKRAFSDCKNLSTVFLGSGISSIGIGAFGGDSDLTEIKLPDGILSIGGECFSGCSSLKKTIIGKGISILPWKLFWGCSSLSSITIPNTVMEIGDNVFDGCTNLTDVVFEDSATTNNQTISLGSNYSRPLFGDCKLDEVYIGRKLSYKTSSYYGFSPFYRNTTLRKVIITDAETQIYDNEFYGCSNLQEFQCGDGVTAIGNWAFSGCSSLKSYLSGTSVKTIGQEAFSDCTALTSFISNATTPPTCGTQALDDINKWECKLYVPSASIADYKAAEQWKDFFFIGESGVEDVMVDESDDSNLPIEIYNLNGVKVGNTVDGLPAGMYITKQGKIVGKLLVH